MPAWETGEWSKQDFVEYCHRGTEGAIAIGVSSTECRLHHLNIIHQLYLMAKTLSV